MTILVRTQSAFRLHHFHFGCQQRFLLKSYATGKKDLSPEVQAKREKYLNFEREFESKVDYSQLTDKEKAIHQLHKEAVEEFKWTYIDPESGNKVNTRFRKFCLDKCCGSGCRHCIYDHENVGEDQKGQKRFNSAFWVPI